MCIRDRTGVEGVDARSGELLQGEQAESGDQVAADVAFIGEVGRGADGGADSGEPLSPEELTGQHAGGLDVGARGERGHNRGQGFLGFALGGESGFHLLAAGDGLLQGALADGAGGEAFPFDPEAFAAGGTTLQGLGAEFGYVLPGCSLLYVTLHACSGPCRPFPWDVFSVSALPLVSTEMA